MILKKLSWGLAVIAMGSAGTAAATIDTTAIAYPMTASYTGEAKVIFAVASGDAGNSLGGALVKAGGGAIRSTTDILATSLTKQVCVNSNVAAAGAGTGGYSLKVTSNNSNAGVFRMKATASSATWYIPYTVTFSGSEMLPGTSQTFSNASFVADTTDRNCSTSIPIVMQPTGLTPPPGKTLGDSTEAISFADTLSFTLTPL